MMTQPFSASPLSRRAVLAGGVAAGALALSGRWNGARAAPLITVESVSLDVNGKAAKVYAIQGLRGRACSRRRATASPAPSSMRLPSRRSCTGTARSSRRRIRTAPVPMAARWPQGERSGGLSLTPGTHWMHSHTLSEQQLLAAPLVTREADAGDVQDVVLMLHDFSFRTPEEILAGLGGANGHGAHGGHNMGGTGGAATGGTSGGGMSMAGMDHSGHNMGSMGGMGAMASGGAMNHSGHSMPGGAMGGSAMVHANDVDYDAFLANRRTLADPQVVPVEKGGRVRLRIINGGTASAFFISVPGLKPRCVAVDGTPCVPLEAALFPLAQGQRIDLVVDVPAGGGAFPVLAQVEASPRRTGLVLATPGASVARITDTADTAQGLLSLELEGRLSAAKPLAARKPDKSFSLLLGEQPGYRWTINGAVYGEAPPFVVNQGERVEMTFMNPTSMNHPMHLHGHHFQVVGIGTRRFSGRCATRKRSAAHPGHHRVRCGAKGGLVPPLPSPLPHGDWHDGRSARGLAAQRRPPPFGKGPQCVAGLCGGRALLTFGSGAFPIVPCARSLYCSTLRSLSSFGSGLPSVRSCDFAITISPVASGEEQARARIVSETRRWGVRERRAYRFMFSTTSSISMPMRTVLKLAMKLACEVTRSVISVAMSTFESSR